METTITRDTLLVHCTVGQLVDFLLQEGIVVTPTKEIKTINEDAKNKRYVYGLKGIMQLFGVSNLTAQRYKRGIIREAVKQNGRIIVNDVDLALKLFAEKQAVRPHLGGYKNRINSPYAQELQQSYCPDPKEDFKDI